ARRIVPRSRKRWRARSSSSGCRGCSSRSRFAGARRETACYPSESARITLWTTRCSMQSPAFGPFRIALIGDFSGRANRGIVERGRALASRRPMRVDRDSLDDAIARIAPKLELGLGGERLEVGFSSLDDFHPDRLYERLPRFRAMRDA